MRNDAYMIRLERDGLELPELSAIVYQAFVRCLELRPNDDDGVDDAMRSCARVAVFNSAASQIRSRVRELDKNAPEPDTDAT